MEKLKWYVVNNNYINYLKKYDKLVQNIDYGKNLKPYIGIIFKINNFDYYVPISSAKEKYSKLKEGKDLIKIIDKDKLLGVINLNNMVPIAKDEAKLLDFMFLDNYKKFKNNFEKSKYISLLNNELSIINKRREEIFLKSKLLYGEKIKHPNSHLSKRCCNFLYLEEKCLEYQKNKFLIHN